MMNSIDSPVCKHQWALLNPSPCPECTKDAAASVQPGPDSTHVRETNMGPARYRKKPVVIEAARYMEYGKLVKGMCNSMTCYRDGNTRPHVHTIHNGQIVNLVVGDWIIPEPDGKHYYPCKPNIFAEIYESAEPPENAHGVVSRMLKYADRFEAIDKLPHAEVIRRWALSVDAIHADKNSAYSERNMLVATLAHLFPSGTAKTTIPDWDPEWHGCVYIDLPTGQVSWHYHDSEAHLFTDLPAYTKPWDGHTTPEKYERLARLRTGKSDVSQ